MKLNHEGHEDLTKVTKFFSVSLILRSGGAQGHEGARLSEGHEVHPDTPV